MTRRFSLLTVALIALVLLLLVALTNQRPNQSLGGAAPAAAKAYGRLAIGGLSINVLVTKHTFQVARPGAGAPTFEDLSVVKSINSASPALMGSLAAGEHFPSARVTVFKPNSTAKLVTYKLGDVVVSGLEQTARKETVTLQYDRIEMTSGGVSACREISSNTAC